MKFLLPAIILLHGLIHLMGFAKAFQLVEIKDLIAPISKPIGMIWLMTAVLFMIAGVLCILGQHAWYIWGGGAVLLSNFLIIYFWDDAKWGTIANLIILLAAIIAYSTWNFENSYQKEVMNSLQQIDKIESELLTENDLTTLPTIVQQYLRYVGVVHQPKVNNVKIEFEGEMRSKEKDWFQFTSEQHNFFKKPTRLFFMKAKISGLPTNGYHQYKNGQASMWVKLLSLFPVVNESGKEMNQAETVTFFNDMCLFAPAALIDKRIKWESLDSTSVKATFFNKELSISALLYFNQKGQLVNFVSDDRYEITDKKFYRFSTPIATYKNFNGYQLCSLGEGVWHYPEGKFTYGKFYLKQVEYNVSP